MWQNAIQPSTYSFIRACIVKRCNDGSPDRCDNYLPAPAEITEAEFLVTGDKASLELKRYSETKIVTPAALLEVIER